MIRHIDGETFLKRFNQFLFIYAFGGF